MSDNIEAIIQRAEQYCQAHGARLTEKRKHVLSGLLLSEKALSAYELVDFCKDEFDEVMPVTSVYRILAFLEEEHLVHKLNLANKYIACSHIMCDHDHNMSQFLICKDCSKVREINMTSSSMDELQKNMQAVGFELVGQQLEMNCICQGCKIRSLV